MSHATLANALAQRLRVPVGWIEEGTPRRVDMEGDLALEFRWNAQLPALCLGVPLGLVLRASQAEILVLAMSANLYLADSGQPHFALCPGRETLYLCCTLSGDPPDLTALDTALDLLLTMARQARAQLRAQGGLA